jgi:hypothetical protein
MAPIGRRDHDELEAGRSRPQLVRCVQHGRLGIRDAERGAPLGIAGDHGGERELGARRDERRMEHAAGEAVADQADAERTR